VKSNEPQSTQKSQIDRQDFRELRGFRGERSRGFLFGEALKGFL